MTEKHSRMKQRKQVTRKRRKWLYIIPIIILLIPVTYFGYLYFKAESAATGAYEDDGREKSDLREEKVNPKHDNVSVLIMGVDENEHRDNAGASRTDTMILATLNKKENSVKLLSIPRDSYVYIPERGYNDKINHAHFFGGTKSAIETVENLLDVPVDYYVKLNFHAFIDVIDALNGITMDVPYEFKESNSMDKRDSIHLLPGEQVLDGEEALALARTRKHDNDIQRGKRQLDIIKAVVDKAVSVTSILKYDDVIDAVFDNIRTNMSFSDMKSFVSYGTSGKLDIESYTLDGTDYWPENVYYWKVDEEALTETQVMLKEHLNLNTSQTATESEEEADSQDAAPPLDSN